MRIKERSISKRIILTLHYLLRMFMDLNHVKLVSPYRGNVVPSTLLSDVIMSNDVFGSTLGIQPIIGEAKAPCNCVVARISELGNAMVLKSGKTEIVINIGLDYERYRKEQFKTLVEVGQKIKKGHNLIAFDLNSLYEQDRYFVCTVTVKPTKANTFTRFINAKNVDYDTIICNVNLG